MPPNHGDEGAGPDPGTGGGVRVEVVDRAAGGVCTIQSVSSCLIGGVTVIATGFDKPEDEQAVRISDKTAFFLLGEMIEFGDTDQIFSAPKNQKTEDYISGRFG